MAQRNIVVGQSGGPTAVINSSLAGVVAAAKDLGYDKIYGMHHGIQGFLNEDLVDISEYVKDKNDIELLKRTPSAFLGSCRFKLPKIEGNEEIYDKIFEIMERTRLNVCSTLAEMIPWIRSRCCPTMRN